MHLLDHSHLFPTKESSQAIVGLHEQFSCLPFERFIWPTDRPFSCSPQDLHPHQEQLKGSSRLVRNCNFNAAYPNSDRYLQRLDQALFIRRLALLLGNQPSWANPLFFPLFCLVNSRLTSFGGKILLKYFTLLFFPLSTLDIVIYSIPSSSIVAIQSKPPTPQQTFCFLFRLPLMWLPFQLSSWTMFNDDMDDCYRVMTNQTERMDSHW
jgi:hypothetical protein